MFFTALIQLKSSVTQLLTPWSQTTLYLPDCYVNLLFTPIAKYLAEIFPEVDHLKVIDFKPGYALRGLVFMFAIIVNLS